MRSPVRSLVLAVVLALALSGAALLPGTASADTPATVLYNQGSDRCPGPGAFGQPELHPCAPSDNPLLFGITPVPGRPGSFTVHPNSNPKFCLSNGGRVVQCPFGSSGERWEVTPFNAGGETAKWDMIGVRLRNEGSGQCLDNDTKPFGGWKLYMTDCADSRYQQWDIDKSVYTALFGPIGAHKGMTWANLEQRADNLVHVGYDGQSDPYHGDTWAGFQLPVLCIKQDGRPAPVGMPPTPGSHAWGGGELKATAPVAGTLLTGRAVADQLCASSFGTGFRMTEFHDAGGWGMWANGTLPTGTRFWTAIDDQPANLWS
ncbi:hypothetical protein ABZW03_36675 [Kitasatospora sp. NPDC004799]|uniref:hypothetical protein n=1 Tax=Kitasatospora sp. NPDC004799 TaxID=3154460 RepID=UPI0033B79C97